MLIVVMWKSTSSNVWEYLTVWEDLGSSPMYAIYVLFELVVLWLYDFKVVCSNLVENEIDFFIFANNGNYRH